MNERFSRHPTESNIVDKFLDQQAEELDHYLKEVMESETFGFSSTDSVYKANSIARWLTTELNLPSEKADHVIEPLIQSLASQGVQVSAAKLSKMWGGYGGNFIVYSEELDGILKASVLAHEAAHHFAAHSPSDALKHDEEAIAESAAMLALGFLEIDTRVTSLPYIAKHVEETGSTNGFILWKPYQNSVPIGIRRAKNAARQIIHAVDQAESVEGVLLK